MKHTNPHAAGLISKILTSSAALALLAGCSSGTLDGGEGDVRTHQQAVIADADVEAAWDEWKLNHVDTTFGCSVPSGEKRAMQRNDQTTDANLEYHTTSEGMSYLMIGAALNDDATLLSQGFKFVKRHSNGNGLMHWQIGCDGTVTGENSATDADVDMAYALLLACKKDLPSPAGEDWCAEATSFIGKIKQHDIDAPTLDIKPGDSWNPCWNGSYFAPAFFKVFGQFTNDEAYWDSVNARNYEILNNAAHSETGLIGGWNYSDGSDCVPGAWSDPDNFARWAWDAPRIAWRLALEKEWFNTTPPVLQRIGDFFAPRLQDIRQVYEKDGTTSGIADYGTGDNIGFFTSQGAVATWAATNDSAKRTEALDRIIEVKTEYNGSNLMGYFTNYHRFVAMAIAKGVFQNPMDLDSGGTTSSCGDGTCNSDEDCSSCSTDCGECTTTSSCGDGTCDSDEDCSSCETDCGACSTDDGDSTTGDIAVQYKAGDTDPINNSINPHLQLVNNGSSSVDLATLAVRYWFTDEPGGSNEFHCDWANMGCSNVAASFGSANGMKYMEVTFGSGSISAGGNSGGIQTRFNSSNWGNFDETDDHSADLEQTAFADHMNVTLYQSGTLVWGSEPGSSTDGDTSTSSCGDGTCDSDEDCSSCESDCGSCDTCGDGVCDSDEDCSSCSSDCGSCSSCGDGVCDSDEDCSSCETDCGSCSSCGDGVCDSDEDCSSCSSDCGSCDTCGDGVCDSDEDCSSCSSDCGECTTSSDEPCTPDRTLTAGETSSGDFNTTGAFCFRTDYNIAGWGCSNFSGRSVSVNGGTATSSCGGAMPQKHDGYYYFDSTAGDYSYASIYWW